MNLKLPPVLALLLMAGMQAAAAVDVVPAEAVGMSPARLAALTDRLQQEIDNEVTGGMQVLIARRGKVVLYEHLGLADIEAGVPVTEETLFRIYSMTKPVVGAAMMMLYEEGRYSLADPIDRHIPEFAGLKVYAGTDDAGEMILEDLDRKPTIHDLMQHTAGFTYGIFNDTPVDRLYLEKKIASYDDSLQQLIDKLADTPLLHQPGERMVYGVATDIQGYLIQKWTGKSLGEFLDERLFEPLGMDQTMAWAPPGESVRLAKIYTHTDDRLQPFAGTLATDHLRAPGGFSGGAQLISTADDYWRFAQMLLNGGEFDGVRYLAPKSVEMMTTDRLPVPAEVPYRGAGFGLNVGVVSRPAEVLYPVSEGEYFWSGLATTTFWVDPHEELVVILLTQYLPWSDLYFRDLMHRLVHAAILEPASSLPIRNDP